MALRIESRNITEFTFYFADAMKQSLAEDPVAPILTEPHLLALNRRLGIVLSNIRDCTKRRPFLDVIVMDRL